jgi:phosphomannomutase
VEDLSLIASAMRRLREHPPTHLAGLPITRTEDLTQGTDELPPTDGLRYTLDGARVIVRPSGTEPKLKCYLEVVVPVATHAGLPAARAKATDLLTTIKRDLSAAAGI